MEAVAAAVVVVDAVVEEVVEGESITVTSMEVAVEEEEAAEVAVVEVEAVVEAMIVVERVHSVDRFKTSRLCWTVSTANSTVPTMI